MNRVNVFVTLDTMKETWSATSVIVLVSLAMVLLLMIV
jgi:hypothetical protein